MNKENLHLSSLWAPKSSPHRQSKAENVLVECIPSGWSGQFARLGVVVGGVRAGSALVVIRVPSPAPLVEGTQPSHEPREAARATELAVAMVIVDFLKTPAKRRPKAQESTGAAGPLPGGFRAAYGCRATPQAVIPPPAEQVGPFKQTHVCPTVVISISRPISPMRSLLARLCKMPVFVQRLYLFQQSPRVISRRSSSANRETGFELQPFLLHRCIF